MSQTPESSADIMIVELDSDFCCGGGPCTEIAPDLFGRDEESFAHMQKDGQLLLSGKDGPLIVSIDRREAVDEAIQSCPGKCISVRFEAVAVTTKGLGLAITPNTPDSAV